MSTDTELQVQKARPGRKIRCGHTNEDPDKDCRACQQRLTRQDRRSQGKDLPAVMAVRYAGRHIGIRQLTKHVKEIIAEFKPSVRDCGQTLVGRLRAVSEAGSMNPEWAERDNAAYEEEAAKLVQRANAGLPRSRKKI